MKSEWVAVAFRAAIAVVGRTPDLGAPGAPGPFALADPDRLSQLLTDAGFGDVSLEAVTRPVRLGRDVEAAAGYILALPEARQLFGGQSPHAGRRRPERTLRSVRSLPGLQRRGAGRHRLAGDSPPLIKRTPPRHTPAFRARRRRQ